MEVISVPTLQITRHLLATIAMRDVEGISATDRLVDDLLMDSLELIELAMKLEENWGIVLDETGLKQLVTVEDVARLLPAGAQAEALTLQ